MPKHVTDTLLSEEKPDDLFKPMTFKKTETMDMYTVSTSLMPSRLQERIIISV